MRSSLIYHWWSSTGSGEVDAGTDQTIDAGDTVQLAGTGPVGSVWTTSGTGTFDDDEALDAVYTPSEFDIINGVTLTLSNGDNNDSMQVTITVTETYLRTTTPVNFLLDSDDAVFSGSNLTSWPEVISGNNVTLKSTPTKVTSGLDGHDGVLTDGTVSGFTAPRVSFTSAIYVTKFLGTGLARIHNVSNSNTQNSLHAGFTYNNATSRKSISLNGDALRYEFDYATDELDADEGDRIVHQYAFKNKHVFNDNNIRKLNSTTSANTTTSSTATNMQFGFRARGDNAFASSPVADVFTKCEYYFVALFSSEPSIEEWYLWLKYLKQKYPSRANQNTFYEPLAADKDAGNPILDGHEGDASQYYAGNEVYDSGQDDYFTIGKSASVGYAATSTDGGVNYSAISGAKIPLGGAGSADQNGFRSGFIFYDPISTQWKMLYGGRNEAGATDLDQLCLATAPNLTNGGTWTKNGTSAVLTVASVNTALSKSYIAINPVGVFKISSTWYCILNGATALNGEVFLASSTNLTSWTVVRMLFSANSISDTGGIIGGGNVVYLGGKYVMLVSVGFINSDALGERDLYIAISDNPDQGFVISNSPIVSHVNSNNSWEGRRTYGANFTVDNDGSGLSPKLVSGRVKVLYSGHSISGAASPNTGLYGIAYVNSPVFKTYSF